MNESDPVQTKNTRDIPNLWSFKSGHNPYLHNIFMLLGIDPDGSQKAFDRASQRWRQKVASTQETRFGHEITQTDVAHASLLAKQEEEFAAERLLAHTVHEFDSSTLKEVLDQASQLELPKLEEILPLKVRNLSFLTEKLPEPEMNIKSSGSTFPIELLPEIFAPTSDTEDFFEY